MFFINLFFSSDPGSHTAFSYIFSFFNLDYLSFVKVFRDTDIFFYSNSLNFLNIYYVPQRAWAALDT